ncbi:hypothetical protein PT2222_50189 [Paraburkholderia tropica]
MRHAPGRTARRHAEWRAGRSLRLRRTVVHHAPEHVRVIARVARGAPDARDAKFAATAIALVERTKHLPPRMAAAFTWYN